MSEYVIRPFERRDGPAIAALEQRCFSQPWSEQSLASELLNPLAVMRVAELRGEAVGWAGMQAVCGEGSVTDIAVAPAARGLGIGTALTAALCAEARRQKLSSLTLEVRVSNERAIALYERLGFRRLGVRPHFYALPREDALMMCFLIEEEPA
ncbi:MAG: ribosomal protein S18-alanine N-acetyltransferase [Oscillospiraceae bacterium]